MAKIKSGRSHKRIGEKQSEAGGGDRKSGEIICTLTLPEYLPRRKKLNMVNGK